MGFRNLKFRFLFITLKDNKHIIDSWTKFLKTQPSDVIKMREMRGEV